MTARDETAVLAKAVEITPLGNPLLEPLAMHEVYAAVDPPTDSMPLPPPSTVTSIETSHGSMPARQAAELLPEHAAAGGHCIVVEEWEGDDCGFSPAPGFMGARPGFAFMLGGLGLGYYPDAASALPREPVKVLDPGIDSALPPEPVHNHAAVPQSDPGTGVPTLPPVLNPTPNISASPDAGSANQGASAQLATTGFARGYQDRKSPLEIVGKLATFVEADQKPPPDVLVSTPATKRLAPPLQPRVPMKHYWGQALQYFDRSIAVVAGKKLTLLAKRDGNRVRFSLRV